jgi:hypothetical protein
MKIKDLMNLNFKDGNVLTQKDLELLEYQDNVDMIRMEQIQGKGEFADIHCDEGMITVEVRG